jgi:small subunit ribosomal protein S6
LFEWLVASEEVISLKTVINRLYEAMFLVDSAIAASDWDGIIATIRNILEKAQVEIISIKKWEERKLAYEINGKSRGTYILSYFKAEGSGIAGIERDVQLSDRIMRVLVLRADHMSEEDIRKDKPALQAKGSKQKAARKSEVKQANSKEAEEEAE